MVPLASLWARKLDPFLPTGVNPTPVKMPASVYLRLATSFKGCHAGALAQALGVNSKARASPPRLPLPLCEERDCQLFSAAHYQARAWSASLRTSF